MKNRLFVERDNLIDETYNNVAKGCLGYSVMFLFFIVFIMLGLWCCSCKTPQESIVNRDFDAVMEFDYDNVIGYDSDRNTILYLVNDTVQSKHGIKVYQNVIELDCSNILIEELEQGESAYIDGRRLLYD